jgi:hypothetical protein
MMALQSMHFLNAATPCRTLLRRSIRLGYFAKRIRRAGQYRKAFLHFARAKIRGGARIAADRP